MAKRKPTIRKKSVSKAKTGRGTPKEPKDRLIAGEAAPPPGKRLLTRVREILKERSRKPNGRYNTRFDDVANAYVEAMEVGSFIHTKEFIDREEGKVPSRIADADGKNIKAYIGMPTEGEESP